MAQPSRASSRQVKPRREEGFVYDSDSTNFLLKKRNGRDNQHQESDSSSPALNTALAGKDYTTSVYWSDIDLPLLNIDFGANNKQALYSLSHPKYCVTKHLEGEEEAADDAFVNNSANTRKTSSTRYNFLDFSDNFLSVSSAIHTNSTSGMSGTDTQENSKKNSPDKSGSSGASSSAATSSEQKLDQAVKALVGAAAKIGSMAEEMKLIRDRLDKLEGSQYSDIDRSQPKSKGKKKNKNKSERVEDEKIWQLHLLQDNLRRKPLISYSSSDSEISSEEATNMKTLKSKMSRRKQDLVGSKLSARLKEAGAMFPEESCETTESSGTESGSVKKKYRCRSRKVKSGAKIQKRPVIKTELWPHTIANEDDGENITSDNINLSKFLSCFTYIVTCCGGVESRGRSALLHAVTTVLEYLQWTDARTFHNMIMVKIEQGRIGWDADFSSFAQDFVDKKVRLSMRTRYTGASSSSSYKPRYSDKGAGKGFRGSGQKNSWGKGKPLYGAVCWQWNVGTCTYGDNCKRWHVCKTCAEQGKLGEQHKSSTHDRSGARQNLSG